ncbi:MAG: hypothetical protein KDA41_02185 [Planctomycetales bacterium]|nr:hypothetical protein [Planctomycetales bacterium]
MRRVVRADAGRIFALAALVLFGTAAVVHAETLVPADTSLAAQQDAQQAIPLDSLSPEAQQTIWDVASRPTIFRRLPTERVACDPDMYRTLVRNPELIINIWQMMGVTDISMVRTGAYAFDSDDKAGTTSQIELLYGDDNLHIFYATCRYDGTLLARPVNSRVVLVLRSSFAQAPDGSSLVTSTMDAFIRIDHLTANLVARTLTPMIGRTADHNFGESFRFVARVNATAEENSPGLQQLAQRLTQVQPAVRAQLAEAAGLVEQRHAARQSAASPTIILGQDTPPAAQPEEFSPAQQAPPQDENVSGRPAPGRTITLRR